MLRAMMSGVAGLRTHQTRMDVIANDVANVNTTGYKQSDVTFKETLVTTIRSPAPQTPGQQVGLGVQIGSINKNFEDGIMFQTGQASNMGITGNGFFVVADPGAAAGSVYYTRAGDYIHDVDTATGEIYLQNSSGKRLLGLMGPNPDPTGLTPGDLVPIVLPADTESYSIGLDGVIYATVGGVQETIGMVPLVKFANNFGLLALGNNLFQSTAAAGIQPMTIPGQDGTGQIFQGYLENSNVDLAKEFTEMIITQRGFQANSKTITTSDEMLLELLQLKR
jgi:flagellar hook protein FlgE